MSNESDRKPYPRPADLALGIPAPAGWQPDGIVLRHGNAHEVSIVKEEAGELFVSGLTFCSWIRPEELIREAD